MVLNYVGNYLPCIYGNFSIIDDFRAGQKITVFVMANAFFHFSNIVSDRLGRRTQIVLRSGLFVLLEEIPSCSIWVFI